ncbi:MAG: hypothetical protein ACR2K3_13000, partial [Nocardioides sp.]
MTELDGRVWLRRELLRDGVTDPEIRSTVKSGQWTRVRRGAYCETSFWDGLSGADRHRLMCRAVLKVSHPSTVLSHVSSAIERNAPVWGIALDEVHTTRMDGRGGRRECGIVHHRGALEPDDVDVINGVPVTRAERCAVEVCAMTDVERALITVNGLLHAGQTSIDDIAAAAGDTRYWPD